MQIYVFFFNKEQFDEKIYIYESKHIVQLFNHFIRHGEADVCFVMAFYYHGYEMRVF